MGDLSDYRRGELELARTEDLLRCLPTGRFSVLDIGARDGHFSRLLTSRFETVTALDLKKPDFVLPGVTAVAGDVTHLDFAVDAFDCVFCAEVLEHIADLEKACQEIMRVARHEIIIGVPYREDNRIGRTTCNACGKISPPWGHVNTFEEGDLIRLFAGVRLVSASFVGIRRHGSSALATKLMDIAGNPWGTYDQDEPCIHCGAKLWAPTGARPIWSKACSATAHWMNELQRRLTRPRAMWIHTVFSKQGS